MILSHQKWILTHFLSKHAFRDLEKFLKIQKQHFWVKMAILGHFCLFYGEIRGLGALLGPYAAHYAPKITVGQSLGELTCHVDA